MAVMILKPQSRDDLSRQLADASSTGQKISRVELGALAALLEHHPEDMTATVEAGMTLAALQEALRAARQWLPIDPPHPATLSIGDLLAHDLSGSRRLGCGTIRDYLIGLKVALADGQIIKAGGKVVKNVAGYDLCKLFIGARHSLGMIVEATFKLRPLPEEERFLEATAASMDQLHALSRALLSSPAAPVVLDAHNLKGRLTLVAAFAGVREEVDFQAAIAKALGFALLDGPGLSYQAAFWDGAPVKKLSVLPSGCLPALAGLQAEQFLVHAGNGIIFYRGGKPAPRASLPGGLMDRVKHAYDPRQIFPSYTA